MPVRGGGGGGGSSVVGINATLTPVSETVTKPASGGLISGGMLDGWRMFDPLSSISTLADDGSAFSVSYHGVEGNYYEWMNNKRAYSLYPIICWPNRIMGDFSLELKYTGNSIGNIFTSIGCIVHQRPTDTDWGHHSGIMGGRYYTSAGKAFGGSVALTTKKTTDYAYPLTWSNDNWLKVVRSEQNMTCSWKTGAGSYADLVSSDAWGMAGAAAYVGIAMFTRAGWTSSWDGSSNDIVDILEVNLTGSEWTATP